MKNKKQSTEGAKITLKDRKILFHLSLNARASLSEIAKAVGLSKQVVGYRIERMEKLRIIEGYYAILNIYKLGYAYYRYYVKYQNVNLEKEREIIDYAINHPAVGWVAQLDGRWDLAMVFWARDIAEFERCLDELNNRYGQYFTDKKITVATWIHHFKHKYLLEKKDMTDIILGGKLENHDIDESDRKILGFLARNGRATLLEIAQKFNMSAKAVKYRLKNLIKKEIIIGFNIKLNHKALGYTHQKVFMDLDKATKENISKIMAYLKQHPSVIYITKAIGSADMEFELMVKTNEEFHDFMRNLRYAFSDMIKEYYSFIIYYEPQINYLPMEKQKA